MRILGMPLPVLKRCYAAALPGLWLACLPLTLGASVRPLPEEVPCAVKDAQAWQEPEVVALGGLVGARVLGNEADRLLNVDTDRLLEGYRHRPGRQSWDGEHVGKWLHAATLAWVNTGDARLRAKLETTAMALIACQLTDGYLGTYIPADRWTEWDVWAHKYNLLGLITYMRYTGDTRPLAACRRMADLLCSEFGDAKGQRDIITQGSLQHVGMASTSVLEPMVLLYRFTGDKRYLDFCHYIVRAWESPAGPHIVSTLLAGKGVNRIGDAKAYEMLSCINGALELYRTTGERELLLAAKEAWEDITARRLYLTGTASWHEVFHDDFDLERASNTGETCVTVTWLQFNAQLLRLTGEAKYAGQLERTILNQLFGAQQPDCRKWSYYVNLEGRKAYTDNLDGQCCLSSGPRGVALIPTFAASVDREGVVLNLLSPLKAELQLADGRPVSLAVTTKYPAEGEVCVGFPAVPGGSFALKLCLPVWAGHPQVLVNGTAVKPESSPDGYACIRREWKAGDSVVLQLPVVAGLVPGEHGDQGRAALTYGPLIFALDEPSISAAGQSISTVRLAGRTAEDIHLTVQRQASGATPGTLGLSLEADVIACKSGPSVQAGQRLRARFLPFSEAGANGAAYRIWVQLPQQGDENLLAYGKAFGSEPAKDFGAINDGNPATHVAFEPVKPGEEVWAGVRLEAPARLVAFKYWSGTIIWDDGRLYYPGWFDTSKELPRIEVMTSADSPWQCVGSLEAYPRTKADHWPEIEDAKGFSLQLAKPVVAVAVRIVGRVSGGGDLRHSSLSIGELEAIGTPIAPLSR